MINWLNSFFYPKDKNILVISKPHCGKSCFFQRLIGNTYEPPLSSLYHRNQIVWVKDIEPVAQKLKLNFVLDRSPFSNLFFNSEPNYHLILILIDLSQDNINETIATHKESARIHFPGKKQLIVGTKSDVRHLEVTPNGVVPCSALEGEGFNDVESSLILSLGEKPLEQKEQHPTKQFN